MFQNINFLVQSDTVKSGKKKIILDLKWQNHSKNKQQNKTNQNQKQCSMWHPEKWKLPLSNIQLKET